LRPRVIICEYNPTIPADIDIYATYGSNFGASATALTRIAKAKGYKLAALTLTNCIFVFEDDAPKLAGYANDIDNLRNDESLIYLMTSYSGEYVASRPGYYGLTFPYCGALIGPHHRLPLRSSWQRLVYDSWRFAKHTAKRLLRRD
jgi:hypothetical protein